MSSPEEIDALINGTLAVYDLADALRQPPQELSKDVFRAAGRSVRQVVDAPVVITRAPEDYRTQMARKLTYDPDIF